MYHVSIHYSMYNTPNVMCHQNLINAIIYHISWINYVCPTPLLIRVNIFASTKNNHFMTNNL
jgi:hypothetical protein